AENLVAYVEEEVAVAGAVPTDRRIVVERFRDELGDWRLVVLSPFGGRVHAPWSIAIEARLAERLGVDVRTIWSDDGIAIRLPEGAGESDATAIEEILFPEPEELEDLVVGGLASSSLFASRFRENAARALLLPRRRPGQRTPLWQQRQRAADLLAVASRYGSFPILVETYRECLSDVFDLAALREILRGVAGRDIAVHRVETGRASPFASSLLFDYVATYMYEGDAPLAERRAGALTLDRDLLRELLGQEELRELLDPAALADLELDLQWLAEDRRIRDADHLHDLLRHLGDLRPDEAAARAVGDGATVAAWFEELRASRRAIGARIGGEDRWIAIEDAGRYRDGLGVQPPAGTPEAFLGPVANALDGLLARWARTHGPFLADEPARRWGAPVRPIEDALERLLAGGAIVRGEFRPGGAERDWCDPDVLRSLRRRSLARLRHEVEPVEQAALGRFLPAWHGIAPLGGSAAGSVRVGRPVGAPGGVRGSATVALERLAEVVDQLAGVPIPASVLERDVLAARIPGYEPRLLDELGALGEVAWVGRGTINRDDGRIALYRPGAWLGPPADGPLESAARPADPRHDAIRHHLALRGASFYRELYRAAGGGTDREVLDALWDLVWAGEVTNDTFAPLRALRWRRPAHAAARPRLARLTTLGPPEAAGRWSLVDRSGGVAMGAEAGGVATRTAALHGTALALLARHGIVTRESVAGEAVDGGFAAVYTVLRAMEEAGRIRRGYFVDGLGGAQFALPGALDRLRAVREPATDKPRVDLLAATDPANPYGAVLAWPRRDDADRRPYPRAAGAYVVLVDGVAALYLERGGSGLQPLPAADEAPVAALALSALAALVADGRFRELVVTKVGGDRVSVSPWRERLLAAGFVPAYRGLTLRRSGA
ncbi:MAG: Lhr family helicase, partial [Candidatus Limnocylindrales bacterium]